MITAIRQDRRRGRGAVSNASGRFEGLARESVDDGWDSAADLPPVPVEITREAARSIIARNASPDLPFDRSINPYRGCEHGCIYCYARPSHAYLGLSPGLDFETKLTVKPDAAALLRKALDRKGYTPAPIALGANTDPYQRIEREHETTRGIVEVLLEYRHPFCITTKSALVTRDLDLLTEAAALGIVRVAMSVTTLDHRLSRAMEPRASAPHLRFRAMERLAQAGVPVMAMTAPMIPALNDHEMERLLETARDAGATSAGYVALRLPREISTLFREWLEEHYPDRAARILSHIRTMHGGKDYDAEFGRRMTGTGPYAKLMAMRFGKAIARLGLQQGRMGQRADLFRPPPRAGDQFDLFASDDGGG